MHLLDPFRYVHKFRVVAFLLKNKRNKWNGARISFNSSDVEVLFVSDANGEEYGFNIKIIDGYEASNDIDALWPQFADDMPM